MDRGVRPGPRLRETFAGVAAGPVFLPLGEFNLVGLRFSFADEARRSTRWEISDFPRGGRPWLGLLGGLSGVVRPRSAFGVGLLGWEGGRGGKGRRRPWWWCSVCGLPAASGGSGVRTCKDCGPQTLRE